MTVAKILSTQSTRPTYVAPTEKVIGVLSILKSEGVGAMIVSEDGYQIDGIISERDIVRGLEEFGHEVLDHEVRDLMTIDVVTCTAEDKVVGVMALMDHHRIRHIPVVRGEEFVGIVSIRDIARLRLDEVQSEADAMREYILHG